MEPPILTPLTKTL